MIQGLRELRGAPFAVILVATALIASPVAPTGSRVALAASPAAPLSPRSVHHEVLPNGLEVLLLPEPQRDVASVQIWYRVGLPEEDSETAGYAHLLEHLMFTGTETVPDFRGAITDLGGTLRSGPRRDLTYYANDVPRSAVEAVIALEADRMRGLTLATEAIAGGLDQIRIEEARSAALLGSEAVAEQMWEATYAGHPYGREFAGMVPAGATPERCRAFYARYYGPDRACLVVAGGFELAPLLEAIQEHFGPLQPTGNPRSPLPASPGASDLKLRHAGDESAAPVWIGLGYAVPGEESPAAAPVRLLDSYFNGEAADSLAIALRQGELAAASAVAAYLDYLDGAGLLTVVAALKPGADAERALDQLAHAVARLSQAPIDREDFATVRDRRRLSQALRGATVSQRASELAVGYLHGCGLEAQARADSSLLAVQPADIAQIAGNYLRPEQAVALRVRPFPGGSGAAGREAGLQGAGSSDPPITPPVNEGSE